MLAHRQSARVGDGVSVGQHALPKHGLEHLRAADLAGVVVPHPENEVVDRGVERTGSQRRELVGQAAEDAFSILRRRIGLGAARHDLQVVVREVRAAHAQGPEDPRVGELAERLAGNRLHDPGQQVVPRVRVGVLRARRKVQRLLAAQHSRNLLERDHVGHLHARQGHQVRPVADAAGVVDQVAGRDDGAELRQPGHVGARVRVQVQAAFGFEQQGGHRAELLGHRGDVEHGSGRDGDAVVQVRQAVAGPVHHLALEDDAHRGARSVPVQIGEQGVHPGVRGSGRSGVGRGGRGGAASRRRRRQDGKACQGAVAGQIQRTLPGRASGT